jgi:ribosomal protein S13
MLQNFYNVFNTGVKSKFFLKSFFGLQCNKKKISSHHDQIILKWAENNFLVGCLSKENLKLFVKNKLQMPTFSSLRLKQGYPIRGQRTRSNARTSKRIYSLQKKELNFLFFILLYIISHGKKQMETYFFSKNYF